MIAGWPRGPAEDPPIYRTDRPQPGRIMLTLIQAWRIRRSFARVVCRVIVGGTYREVALCIDDQPLALQTDI
jgi:hypothetical protein